MSTTAQVQHTVSVELTANTAQFEREMARAGDAVGRLTGGAQSAGAATPALQQTAQATQAIGTAAEQSSRQLSGMQQAAQTTATSAAPAMQQTAQATQAVGAAANTTTQAIAQQAQAMPHVEMSAKQMTQALQMIPAQMTDVAVSIASGMPVWMVAIQQGGQLKDSFGGIGPAAKAVSGYVLGMINPLTVAGAALAVVAAGAYAGAKEAQALQHEIINSGNAAGVTSGQLMVYASRIDEVTGTQGRAVEVLAAMAATGEIGATNMQAFAQAAIQFEAAGGMAAEETAKKFAELGKSPLDASLKLNESLHYLTTSTYEQIKALTEQGRTADAANVAQKAFADTISNRAGQMEANLGIVEKAWRGVGRAVSETWDAIKGIGRDAGPEGRADVLSTAITKLEANIKARQAQGYAVPERVAELERLKQEQSIIQSDVRLRKMAADQQARQAVLAENTAQWDKQGAKYTADKAKLDDEIVKARNLGIAAGKSEVEIQTRINEIKADYAKKHQGKKSTANEFAAEQEAAKKWADTLTDLQRIQVDGEAATQNYTKAQQRLLQWFADPQFAQAPDAQKELALAAFEAAHAFETEQAAIKRADAVMREAVAAYNQRLDAEYRAAESIAEQLQKQLDHNAAIGQTVTAIAELEMAKLNEQAVSKERLATLADEIDWSGQLGDAYRKQAADLRALAAAKADGAKKQVAADAAKEAEKEAEKAADAWVRSSERIENSLTDGLMRGFEGGKKGAQNLRDVTENMFKTLVVRPTISAMMTPVAQGVNSLFGGGGSGAGAAGSNGLSTVSSIASLASGLGGSLAAGAGWLTGATSFTGALSAGASLIGTGTLAGAGAGLGMIAGALGPIAAVAMLISSLDDSGTMHTGGAALASSVDGIKEVQAATIGFGLATGDVSDKVVASSKKLAGSALGILQGIEGLTGKKSNWAVSTAFADDSSKDGAWGALRITRDNEKVLDWNDTRQSKWAPKEFADGEAGAKQYGDAVAAGIKQAIDTIDLPDWAANIVKNLGDSPTLEEMGAAMAEIQAMPEKALQAIGTSSQSLSGIIMEGMRQGDPQGAGAAFAAQVIYGIENSMYQGFADQITSIVATDLVTPVVTAMASGATLTEAMATVSIDTMTTKVQAAVAAFDAILSDPELQATLQGLGEKISGGVSASISAGTSGRRAPTPPPTYGSTPAVSQQQSGANDAGAAAKQSKLPDLQDQYTALQIERMRALGNAEEALAKERELALAKLTDVAEREQQVKNWALQDEVDVIKERAALMARRDAATDTTAQALARERDAIKEVNRALFDSVVAAEKAKEIDDERKSLQDELNGLTDTNTQALQRQRDALAESNRELFDQVVAARKAKEAEEQRKSLQDELNGLTDTNVQALQRQRDALDESNRALFDQVVAARKAKEVAEERRAIEDQWLQAIGAESVLRQRQLDALDPTNRSLQQMIYRLEDLRTASDKADQAVDKAYAVLEKSVNAQKEALAKKLEADKKALQSSADVAEKSAASVRRVFDAVQSALRATVLESEELNRLARLQALARLQTGLVQAKAGVSIDKIAGLEDAVSVASKPSEQFYGRFDEYARDQDAARDAMRQIEQYGGAQLSVAELTLKATNDTVSALEAAHQADVDALDRTLEHWRESIEIQRGTYVGVVDMAKAVQGLGSAITAATSARNAVSAVVGSGGNTGNMSGGSSGSGSSGSSGFEYYTNAFGDQTILQEGQSREFWEAVAASGTAAVGSLSALKQRLEAQNKTDVWDRLSSGLTLDYDTYGSGSHSTVPVIRDRDGKEILVYSPVKTDMNDDERRRLNEWAKENGVPGFASGGAFTNGIVQKPSYFDMAMMGEAGPEAIMPLANIGGKLGVRAMGGGMSAEVVNAILGLYGYLQAIASSTDATALHTFNTKKAAEDMVDRGVKVLPALNQPIKVVTA